MYLFVQAAVEKFLGVNWSSITDQDEEEIPYIHHAEGDHLYPDMNCCDRFEVVRNALVQLTSARPGAYRSSIQSRVLSSSIRPEVLTVTMVKRTGEYDSSYPNGSGCARLSLCSREREAYDLVHDLLGTILHCNPEFALNRMEADSLRAAIDKKVRFLIEDLVPQAGRGKKV